MRLQSSLVAIAAAAIALSWLAGWAPSATAQFDGATFTVNSTDDPSITGPINGICDDGSGNCTLREAILEANNLTGSDIITFNIPGTGPHVIDVGGPESDLPSVMESVLIDGSAQAGYEAGVPSIILDGSSLIGDNHGLTLFETTDVTIRGLHIQNFPGDGIIVQGALFQATDITILGSTIDSNAGNGVAVSFEERVRIGSTTPGEANTITRNGAHGIYIEDTFDTIIEGNFIGTDSLGALGLGNGADGIAVVGNFAFNVAILSNSITGNAGLGIDLGDDGITTNDAGDVDASPNAFQNFPVLSRIARPTTSTSTGTGALDAEAGTFLIQFFHDSACDATGFGEGARLVGSGDVDSEGLGPTRFAIPLDENIDGGFLTATATRRDAETAEPLETSEFSPCLDVDLTPEILTEGTCIERGLSLSLSADYPALPGLRFEWDFGDGENATGDSVLHTWAAHGRYTVTLDVHEDNIAYPGDTLVASTTITILVYASGFTEGFFIPGGTTGSFNVSDAFDLIFTGEGEGGFVSGGATASPLPDCLFNEVPAINPSDPSTRRVRAVMYLDADSFGPADGLSMIEVRLYYTQQGLRDQDVTETTLSLWYWNGTAWVDTRSVPIGGTISGATPAEDLVVFARGLNTIENYVWARLDHTSTFAAAGSRITGGGYIPPAEETPPPEEEEPPEETPPEDTTDDEDGESPPVQDEDDAREILLTIYVNDQPITQPLNGVNGRIRIALEGDDDAGNRLRLYIVGQDGFEYYLGFADEIDEIDTGDFPNGLYTLEIRDYGDPRPGVFTTAQAYKVVRAENLLIQNALSAPPEAIAAVAVTVGLVGLGALLAQTFWTQFAQVLSEAGKESAISIGEDRLRKHRRNDGQIRRVITWLTFFGAVSLLGFFFTFEGVEADYGAGFIADFVPMLALIGIAAFAFFVGQFSLEVLANRVSGVSSRFRFLWPGAVALAISAVVFRTPFGYPGYVYESEMEEDRRVVRMKGVRALAVFAIMLTLLVPFIMIGYQWRWDFAQAGILVGLVALGTSTLPFAPLPGADVWRWRKTVSVAAIATSFSLFFGFQLALIPINLFMTLGAVGLPTYVLVLAWLHVRRLDPVPGWYARVSIRYDAFEGWLDSRTPASWKRFRAWRARKAQQATDIALRPVRSLAAYSARAVHRRRVRIAVPEDI